MLPLIQCHLDAKYRDVSISELCKISQEVKHSAQLHIYICSATPFQTGF